VPKKNANSENFYVFQVALKYQTSIWRTIKLPGEATLHELHNVIFKAFDRHDPHLYSFYIPMIVNGKRSRNRRNRLEYTSPEGFEFNPFFDDLGALNAGEVTLDEIGLTRNLKFDYLFDFGDSWEHTITVKSISKLESETVLGITEKHGDSPSQYPDLDDDWE